MGDKEAGLSELEELSVGRNYPWGLALRRFAVLFLPLAALVLGGAWFLVSGEMHRQQTKIFADQSLKVQLGLGALKYRLHHLEVDINYLSHLPSLITALDAPTAANLARVARNFRAFAQSSQEYDQVRWLDNTGMERVRVDLTQGKAIVTPRAALQDKAERYYFRDTLKLPRGRVFLSPLDLNVEHGQIELPYKPMLRIGMPVFDKRGEKRGVVLLNYYGRHLLNRLRQVTSGGTGHLMLLNRNGYWLLAPNPTDEWGFMFHKKALFPSRYPRAWKRILSDDSGQFRDAHGLWTFATFHPLEKGESSSTGSDVAYAPSTRRLNRAQYFWKIASHLSPKQLDVAQPFLDQIIIASGIILTMLAGGSGLMAHKRVREKIAGAKLENLNKRLVAEVDERARAERAARRQETYLATLIRTAPDAIAVIDSQGKVELCNTEFERLFGYASSELVGQTLDRLMPPEQQETHQGYVRRYLETGVAHVIGVGREVEAIDKNGRRLALYLKIGVMGSGDERRFIGFLYDIGVRKQAEAEREHYMKELERSNQELDEFAYVASHDLKEPLRGIHNYATFVIEDYAELLPQDGKDKLGTLTRLSARMEMLINDLLYYSRVGRWELACEPVDMNAMLQLARDSLSARLNESGAYVTVPQPLPPAWGDSTRIPEIFQNLISNAIKYNGRPDKYVEVGWLENFSSTGRAAGERNHVYYVRDNGIGIRENHLENVFRIFKRLHGRDRYGGGSGAGLTITRKIIQRLGGEIWVDSVFGEGSTFYFTLPSEEPEASGSTHTDSTNANEASI